MQQSIRTYDSEVKYGTFPPGSWNDVRFENMWARCCNQWGRLSSMQILCIFRSRGNGGCQAQSYRQLPLLQTPVSYWPLHETCQRVTPAALGTIPCIFRCGEKYFLRWNRPRSAPFRSISESCSPLYQQRNRRCDRRCDHRWNAVLHRRFAREYHQGAITKNACRIGLTDFSLENHPVICYSVNTAWFINLLLFFSIDLQWNTIFELYFIIFLPHKSLIWVTWGMPISKRPDYTWSNQFHYDISSWNSELNRVKLNHIHWNHSEDVEMATLNEEIGQLKSIILDHIKLSFSPSITQSKSVVIASWNWNYIELIDNIIHSIKWNLN